MKGGISFSYAAPQQRDSRFDHAVVVMREGRIRGELLPGEARQESVMMLATDNTTN